MGMNETSILAEPVKSAKERLDDLLAKVEQVKKEVQAEEEAKKVPPKIEIEVWSTIGGYLSDPHRAWYVKPFELFYKKSGGKSLAHALSYYCKWDYPHLRSGWKQYYKVKDIEAAMMEIFHSRNIRNIGWYCD